MEPLESAREQLKKLEDKVATLKQRKAKIKSKLDAATKRADTRARVLVGDYFAASLAADAELAKKIMDSLSEKDQAVFGGWIIRTKEKLKEKQ